MPFCCPLVCVPFPKDFEFQGIRDYDALQHCIGSLPPLVELQHVESIAALSSQQRSLLQWTLLSHPRRKATAFEQISYDAFLTQVPAARLIGAQASNSSLRPHAVFKLQPQAQGNVAHRRILDSSNNTNFGNNQSITAFHGTSFENLHSIIRTGLLPASGTKLERTGAVYGNGIYLAKDLPVAYAFCNAGERWKGSALAPKGTRLRCLLVCSVDQCSSSSTDTESSSIVPKQYLVVDRPDKIYIQYLLLYLDKHQGRNHVAGASAVHGRQASSGCFLPFVLTVCVLWIFWVLGNI